MRTIKQRIQKWLGVYDLIYRGEPGYPKDDFHPRTIEHAEDYIEPIVKGYGRK